MGLDIRHSISNSLFFFSSTDRYVCSFRKRFSAIRQWPFKRQQLVPAHLKCGLVNVTRSGVRFCRSHYFEFSPAMCTSIHRLTLRLRSRLFQRRTRTTIEFDLEVYEYIVRYTSHSRHSSTAENTAVCIQSHEGDKYRSEDGSELQHSR